MIEAKVTGIPDLKRELASIVPKLRVRALRNALAAGGRLVQRAMRGATPVLSPAAPAVLAGRRKPGTVRNAISVRTSKMARRDGDVGVFVNVRPAKGARYKTTRTSVLGVKVQRMQLVRASQRGANSPTDPYYWRWLFFGTKFLRPFPALQRGAAQLNSALPVILTKMRQAFDKLNRPNAPTP